MLNIEAKLMKKITESYNPRVRPVLHQNDTVIVTLGMSLHQIIDLVGINLVYVSRKQPGRYEKAANLPAVRKTIIYVERSTCLTV